MDTCNAGLQQIIPIDWLRMFSQGELQLLISGTPEGRPYILSIHACTGAIKAHHLHLVNVKTTHCLHRSTWPTFAHTPTVTNLYYVDIRII